MELSTFYQPLSHQSSTTYRDAQGRSHNFDPSLPPRVSQNTRTHERRESTIWEEGSEGGESEEGAQTSPAENERPVHVEAGGERTVFGIGDEDEEDEGRTRS